MDGVTIPSKKGKGVLRRVPEVFDCWFESGRYAQTVETCFISYFERSLKLSGFEISFSILGQICSQIIFQGQMFCP